MGVGFRASNALVVQGQRPPSERTGSPTFYFKRSARVRSHFSRFLYQFEKRMRQIDFQNPDLKRVSESKILSSKMVLKRDRTFKFLSQTAAIAKCSIFVPNNLNNFHINIIKGEQNLLTCSPWVLLL
jgi:hypothetical protein